MLLNDKKFWDAGLTVDAVIFTVEDGELKVLLTKRDHEPFAGRWTLPGSFLLNGEELIDAARRALEHKTNLSSSGIYLEQLYSFDEKGRDPRGQVITVAYFALVPASAFGKMGDGLELCPIAKLPSLGFDHKQIIEYAIKRLVYKLEYTNVVFSLLPKQFTLSQLQGTYEAILGGEIDKRNFIKKFMSLGLVKATDKTFSSGRQRPARLYQFISTKPTELKKFF